MSAIRDLLTRATRKLEQLESDLIKTAFELKAKHGECPHLESENTRLKLQLKKLQEKESKDGK